MKTNLLSSRLAAKTGIRQTEALDHTDAIGDAIDQAAARWWQQFLHLLARGRVHQALDLSRHLVPFIRGTLAREFTRLAHWGHQSAVAVVVDTLPLPAMQAALLTESRLTEETPDATARFLSGLLSFGFREPNEADFGTNPLLGQLATATDPDQQRGLFAQLLFPPPSAEQVNAIVYATDWQARLQSLSKLASPESLAATVTQGLLQGKTQQQIAKDLLPLVDGVRSSARRIARTEGMRVAHAVQVAAWDQMGDMVVGYQVHATLDQHTRPWHAHRNGQIYYKLPKPGQKGMAQCPHPPTEPEDPTERPAGTPQVAPNCRCWLAPVLKSLDSITSDPATAAIFTDAHDRLIVDPETFDQWFQGTTVKRQMLSVGAKRWNTVAAKLEGRPPAWADFVHPKTGDLLPVAALKKEPPSQRKERVNKVGLVIAQRRALLRKVGAFGFVPAR